MRFLFKFVGLGEKVKTLEIRLNSVVETEKKQKKDVEGILFIFYLDIVFSQFIDMMSKNVLIFTL